MSYVIQKIVFKHCFLKSAENYFWASNNAYNGTAINISKLVSFVLMWQDPFSLFSFSHQTCLTPLLQHAKTNNRRATIKLFSSLYSNNKYYFVLIVSFFFFLIKHTYTKHIFYIFQTLKHVILNMVINIFWALWILELRVSNTLFKPQFFNHFTQQYLKYSTKQWVPKFQRPNFYIYFFFSISLLTTLLWNKLNKHIINCAPIERNIS